MLRPELEQEQAPREIPEQGEAGRKAVTGLSAAVIGIHHAVQSECMGLATAGIILGWIGIAILLVAVGSGLALFAASTGTGTGSPGPGGTPVPVFSSVPAPSP